MGFMANSRSDIQAHTHTPFSYVKDQILFHYLFCSYNNSSNLLIQQLLVMSFTCIYDKILCFTEQSKVSIWKQPLPSPANLQTCLYFPFWSFSLWMYCKSCQILVKGRHYLYGFATPIFSSLIGSSLWAPISQTALHFHTNIIPNCKYIRNQPFLLNAFSL